MARSKHELMQRRRLRVRNKLRRTNHGRLRLSVYRSNKNLSAQIIDDVQGRTLCAVSTLEPKLGLKGRSTVETAAKIGAEIAARAKAAGIEEVYFDRGGYLYHGQVKALADAAREAGLKF